MLNPERIYSHAPTDIAAVKAFVAGRDDMNYPIYIDTHRSWSTVRVQLPCLGGGRRALTLRV